MARKEETVERGYGYRIYFSEGIYFLDLHKNKIDGYDTLAGAKEAAYYAGVRDTKE
jgi:hypothetical protein